MWDQDEHNYYLAILIIWPYGYDKDVLIDIGNHASPWNLDKYYLMELPMNWIIES